MTLLGANLGYFQLSDETVGAAILDYNGRVVVHVAPLLSFGSDARHKKISIKSKSWCFYHGNEEHPGTDLVQLK